MIKLINLQYTKEYGGDMWILTILSSNKYALVQSTFSLDNYCGWPWLRIDVGLNELLSILISIWRVTVEFNFFTKVGYYD